MKHIGTRICRHTCLPWLENDNANRSRVAASDPEEEEDDYFEDNTRLERRWVVSPDGEHALAKNDYHQLRTIMEESLKRAQQYGMTIDRLLYGRYWGAGLVAESSFTNCFDWDKGEETPDNRIHGRIKVEVLTGIMWRRRPYRAGETVLVESSQLSGDEGIRGCPKPGDIVGYVEYPYSQLWEKIFIPKPQVLVK